LEERWIFVLKLRNRPGVLSVVTSTFASRGVSLETLIAHDSIGLGEPLGTAVLTFSAAAKTKDHLARVLTRLAIVDDVREYRYADAEHARKSALARITLPAEELSRIIPVGVTFEIVREDPTEIVAIVLGPPPQVDTVIQDLLARGVLIALDSTVIVV